MNARQPINMHSYMRFSEVAQRCGLDVDDLLAYAGLYPDTQHRRNEKLPLQTIARLYQHGLQTARTGYFPVVLAECFSFDFFPEVETFLATSSHLGEASKLLHWLPELLLSELRFSLDTRQRNPQLSVQVCRLQTGAIDPFVLDSIEDSVTCCMLMFIRKLHVPVSSITLHFHHPAIEALQRFAASHDVRPRFSSGFTGLSGPAALWTHPIARRNNPIHSQTEIIIENVVHRLQRKQGISDCVRRELAKNPMTPMADIAADLQLSLRTLQRQLRAEGQTFQSLQNETLLELAQQHLKTPGLDMESVAAKLGFSDRHSFTRAYKRWTGVTPSRHRKDV